MPSLCIFQGRFTSHVLVFSHGNGGLIVTSQHVVESPLLFVEIQPLLLDPSVPLLASWWNFVCCTPHTGAQQSWPSSQLGSCRGLTGWVRKVGWSGHFDRTASCSLPAQIHDPQSFGPRLSYIVTEDSLSLGFLLAVKSRTGTYVDLRTWQQFQKRHLDTLAVDMQIVEPAGTCALTRSLLPLSSALPVPCCCLQGPFFAFGPFCTVACCHVHSLTLFTERGPKCHGLDDSPCAVGILGPV